MKKYLLVTILISFLPLTAMAEPWSYKGRVLHPNCFQTEWYSSDNIQAYYERFMGIKKNYYRTKEFNHFLLNLGGYWGKNITSYDPIKAWGEEVELAVFLESCLNKTSHAFGDRGQWITSASEYGDEYSYKILKEITMEHCQDLAPHIDGRCIQSYLLDIYEAGGSSGSHSYHIYGLFKLSDGREYIFPLKTLNSLNDSGYVVD
ncbi:MAG: hypothetical protein ACR2PW_06335 [Gammaproteobacteria bacterium]